MRTFATLSLSICLFLASCKREAPASQQALTSPPTAQNQPALAAPTSPGVPGSEDLAPLAHLAPELSAEAAHRPTAAVPAERVFDALAAAGVQLSTKHQVLATTAAASYCMLGVTADTVAIAVCEYPTHDAAVAGEHLLDDRYRKLVPDAKRAVNGQTLVTVANAEHHAAVRDRVFETFKSL